MSGGSLDYVTFKVSDAADRIDGRGPLYSAFAKHLRLVAKALYDTEWVMSSDYSPGDEEAAIRAVINRSDEIDAAREAAEKALADLKAALAATEDE